MAEHILEALSDAGLIYGDMGIFHRLAREGNQPIFSCANMVKPGHFELDGIEDFVTPGVTLFLRLPGPVDGLKAFDEMYGSAQRIAETLGGELRDASRSMMCKQTAGHIREEIRDFKLRLTLAERG